MDVKSMIKEEKQVYIVLTDTGTWLARLIRMYTKKPLNHTSIALDHELKEVYGFGRKRPNNPFIGGFVKENLRDAFFKDSTCAIYSCSLNELHYRNIRYILEQFEKDSHLYKYNFIGLFGVVLNIRMNREQCFFCSQFVASVFDQAGIQLVQKDAAFTTPGDIEQSDKLKLVYQGKLRFYGDREDSASIEASPYRWLPGFMKKYG